MFFILGMDRSPTLLLPESLEDDLGAQHPVRFLETLVEGLDLKACGLRRTAAADPGRLPFAPGDLWHLYPIFWSWGTRRQSSGRSTPSGIMRPGRRARPGPAPARAG